MIERIYKTLISKSFIWIFILTFLLYAFSVRFPVVFYIVPFAIFLAYFFLNRQKNKLSIIAVLFFLILSMFPLFLVIGGLYGLDFSIRIKAAFYIVLFLFPLILIFYNEAKKHPIETTYNNLLVSYVIIGLLLFFLYNYGMIAANRYQHVGNILAATSLLILGLKNKQTKWTLFFIWLVFVLSVGSRQALLGLVFCGLIYVFIANYKVFITFVITSILVYLNGDFILAKIEEISYANGFNTILRIIYAINTGGGNSVNTRIKIYKDLIQEVKLLPNLSFTPNTDLLLPHNFFLEYFITCGILLGIIFILFILWLVFSTIVKNKNSILVYFTLFYFISFNVSTGIGAAKYFIYYCFLLIIIREKQKTQKINYEENIIGQS